MLPTCYRTCYRENIVVFPYENAKLYMLPHVTVLFKNNIYIIILKSTVTCGNMLKKGALSGKIDGNMYGNMSVTCGNMLHKDIRRH